MSTSEHPVDSMWGVMWGAHHTVADRAQPTRGSLNWAWLESVNSSKIDYFPAVRSKLTVLGNSSRYDQRLRPLGRRTDVGPPDEKLAPVRHLPLHAGAVRADQAVVANVGAPHLQPDPATSVAISDSSR